MGKRARVIGSTAETARKRPERPWTAARTMEVLRRCPLAIAQRLVHCAIALSTAVLDRVTKTMSVAPLLTNNLDNSKQKMSNLLSPAPPPYSWSLLGKSEGPAPPPSSKTLDLLISPGTWTQLLNYEDIYTVSGFSKYCVQFNMTRLDSRVRPSQYWDVHLEWQLGGESVEVLTL